MIHRYKNARCQSPIALLLTILCLAAPAPVRCQDPYVPESLKPWTGWVLRDADSVNSPKLYSDGQTPIVFWPSSLSIVADNVGGSFSLDIEAFDECWVPLPGSSRVWPAEVKIADVAVPVIQRDDRPTIELSRGRFQITGQFRWPAIPEKIRIPEQIGVISLTVDGVPNRQPTWDSNGEVWLKRARSEIEDKDGISLQVYRLIEDGIPIWLRTEIELTVSGKSREEEIGWVIPQGWRISTVESPIPVAIDDRGIMKAQVRAGKWTVRINAFINRDIQQISFAENAMPPATSELVGFRANPQFRIAQIEGLPSIDVSQTSFPDYWKPYPVYLWDTSTPFQLLQRMRGMGDSAPSGLTINRRLWLDENGAAFTYEDNIEGQAQKIWRLDVADRHQLGSVRVDNVPQLITENPMTGKSGVEIRQRNLNLSAVGRVDRMQSLSATGWQASADSLQLVLTLPPGWRALAIFGADRVNGDWLTAWSLLDLFLLLIFSFAVFRLSGFLAGAVALLAFALSYHESGAPRFIWLFLLVPLALERVVPSGNLLRIIKFAKYSLVVILLLVLIPFVAFQIQSVIYPQLELSGQMYVQPSEAMSRVGYDSVDTSISMSGKLEESFDRRAKTEDSRIVNQNMINDPQALIQTGPAKPRWDWNSVECYWSGPVGEDQSVRLFLISLAQHRLLAVVRISLLLALLAMVLLRRKSQRPEPLEPSSGAVTAALTTFVLVSLLFSSGTCHAQFPDNDMLQALRAELLSVPDAFPGAATIASATMQIDGENLTVTCDIHAAAKCAVPLPGQLPTWSPLTVAINDESNVTFARRDGYLWVVVDEGVHQVNITGLVPDQSDWEWTYLLAPKRVAITAPGWKINGIRPDGTPEGQILLSREQAATSDAAAYDRTQFQPIVMVQRNLEIGILSKIRTVITRIGDNRRAVSMSIPLVNGERVLTPNQDVSGGQIAVRMPAGDESFSWDSELPSGATVLLTAADTDQWVEKWYLSTSPLWNVRLAGLQPVFEPNNSELIPVWSPWPGESVEIDFLRPDAIAGDVITVQGVQHATEIGDRRQNTKLTIQLECSLATDFPIDVGPAAVVTNLTIDNQSMPVQRRERLLVIPAKSGNQEVVVNWYVERPLGMRTDMGRVVLPTMASNVDTTMQVPSSRWVLWASGPQRGPAVRFWTILIVALLIAVGLSQLPRSPLRLWEWMLLAIGLTQVPIPAAMFVTAWLFLLAFRGGNGLSRMQAPVFNAVQVVIVLMTTISLFILVYVVSAGLLGSPDMFVLGNGSSQHFLRWLSPRSPAQLPVAGMISISVWFYRLAMLFWALWLATSLIRWLTQGWQNFGKDGFWRQITTAAPRNPPNPTGDPFSNVRPE